MGNLYETQQKLNKPEELKVMGRASSIKPYKNLSKIKNSKSLSNLHKVDRKRFKYFLDRIELDRDSNSVSE